MLLEVVESVHVRLTPGPRGRALDKGVSMQSLECKKYLRGGAFFGGLCLLGCPAMVDLSRDGALPHGGELGGVGLEEVFAVAEAALVAHCQFPSQIGRSVGGDCFIVEKRLT